MTCRVTRAFDYQPAGAKEGILKKLVATAGLKFSTDGGGPREELIVTEALARLKPSDLQGDAFFTNAVQRVLEKLNGTPTFVDLVDKLSLADRYPELLVLVQKNPDAQTAINAVRVLLDKGESARIERALRDANEETAVNTAKALGTAADGRAVKLLLPLVKDAKQPLDLRRQAVARWPGPRTACRKSLSWPGRRSCRRS